MPDISKINNVEVANISKLDSITFADGQKVNNQDVSLITDAHTFIKSETASADSSITFTHGTGGVVLDSTYDVYEWHFINMHPATDNVTFQFQVTTSGGNGKLTTSYFRAKHNEDDSATGLDYITAFDTAGAYSYQVLPNEIGNDNDQSASGVLTLYSPSSTTYYKHFTARVNDAHPSNIAMDCFIGGYVESTATITALKFQMSSGNIDAGEIRMYGVATS